jgi:uncharacterized protein (DUF427 family)
VSATQQKLPGPDHPITIESHSGRVVVRAGDQVVADTTAALALREASYPPVLYVPFADLDESLLIASETTSYCPYKGTAAYHSVRTDDGVVQDAIWFYPEPYEAVGEIAGHVAFYPDRVTIDE